MSRNSTGLHPGLHSGHSVASVSVVAFGGGARYGVRRQVFSSLFKFLPTATHATGVSLDPMDDCNSCAYMSWSQYTAT